MDPDSDDNEQAALCEKIISDLHAVFLKDTELSSFEIIPMLFNCNKSPVVHVEHNLGLESWCAKHVYDHAHKTLIPRPKAAQAQQQQLLQQQHQPQQQQQHHHPLHYTRNLFAQSDVLVKYLNVALLVNPDVTTFWHMRRQLVQTNRLPINSEFKFSALILSKKPKSSEAFAYRRWLFSFQSADAIDWPYEIGLCDRCADRSSSNYHAWSHRQWALQRDPSLISSEIMRSERFILKHISDYSSYHYRQTVIAYAYETGYYDMADLLHLSSLRQLIGQYMGDSNEVSKMEELLRTLLPDIVQSDLSEERLKSFLYCCNLAAHDMILCVTQKATYGDREAFELHRRASLRFIVVHSVQLLMGDKSPVYRKAHTSTMITQFNAQIQKYDYISHPFLVAVYKAESARGENHRRWCKLFLGFKYDDDGPTSGNGRMQ